MRKKSVKQTPVLSSVVSVAETNPEISNSEREEIARLAYSFYEARNGDGGSPEDDWFRAESELQNRRTP
jgi:hypothetical protein